MVPNYTSFFKTVFQLLRDSDKAKYKEIHEKVSSWWNADTNKEKNKTIEALGEAWLRRFEEANDPEVLSDCWNRQCKESANFIINEAFDFTFQRFYLFILKNLELKEEEVFVKFLRENQAELSTESETLFANYFKNLNDKKYHDHLQFYDSLNLKLAGEDAETSKLMLALLFFRIMDTGMIWRQMCIEKVGNIEASYYMYLIVSVLAQAYHDNELDQIDEETFFLLEQCMQSVEKNILPQAIIEKFITVGLSNKIVMKIISLFKEFIDPIDPNKYITLRSGDKPELCLIHILKLIKDPTIFVNLIELSFFERVFIFPENLDVKPGDNNIQEVFDALCDATNEKTKIMWSRITIAACYLEDEIATARLKATYPRVLAYPVINTILNGDRKIREFTTTHKAIIELGKQNAWDLGKQNAWVESKKNAKKTSADIREKIRAIEDQTVTYWNTLFSMALTEDPILRAMLDHEDFMFYMKGFLVKLVPLTELRPRYLLGELLKHLTGLNEKTDIFNKVWSLLLFDALKNTKSAHRKSIFLLAPPLQEIYEDRLSVINAVKKNLSVPSQVKHTLKDDRIRENKEILFQKQRAEQKTVAPVQSVPHTPAKKPAKKVAPPSAPLKPVPLQLTLSQRDVFSKAIAAVVAGNPDVEVKWVEEAGYFIVNFAQLGNKFKIAKLNSPNFEVITLTDKARDEFFNKYVPSRLKLLPEVSVLIEGDVLHIEPKQEHCPYPNEIHGAAFDYLVKHGELAKTSQASLLGAGSQTVFKPNNKKKDPSHHLKLLKPANSITANDTEQKMEVEHTECAVKLLTSPEVIKQICCEITKDVLPHQHFNFLRITKDKRQYQYIAEVNLKGTACLAVQLPDSKQAQVDTYIILKSIMVALQDKYYKDGLRITITPDELDPSIYQRTVCKLTIKATKEKLESILADIRQDKTMCALFDGYVGLFNNLASCYVRYTDCVQEALGRSKPEVMMVTPSQEVKEVLYKAYQHLKISNEQLNCLDALFAELTAWNAMLAQVKEKGGDASLEIAIESAKFVCYHRIFHNVTWALEDEDKKTEAGFMRTLRDVFRHGYLEVEFGFMDFVERWVALLMTYQKNTVQSMFASSENCLISWPITQSVRDELLVKIKPFFQAKSNHAIGNETINERVKTVISLKTAIDDVKLSSCLDEAQKQSMILAMMSRIGEIDKTEKSCVDVFGRLGTHDQSLTALPSKLTADIYVECVLGAQLAKCGL